MEDIRVTDELKDDMSGVKNVFPAVVEGEQA